MKPLIFKQVLNLKVLLVTEVTNFNYTLLSFVKLMFSIPFYGICLGLLSYILPVIFLNVSHYAGSDYHSTISEIEILELLSLCEILHGFDKTMFQPFISIARKSNATTVFQDGTLWYAKDYYSTHSDVINLAFNSILLAYDKWNANPTSQNQSELLSAISYFDLVFGWSCVRLTGFGSTLTVVELQKCADYRLDVKYEEAYFYLKKLRAARERLNVD